MPQVISSLPPDYIQQTGRMPGTFDPETFELPVCRLQRLKCHVEDTMTGLWQIESEMSHPEDLPEILSRGWVTMKGSYKLDLARTIPQPHSPKSTVADIADASPPDIGFPHTLSLYITAIDFESQPIDCSFTAGVFVGIMPLRSNVGQRFAETKYVWSYTTEFEFSTDNDYCAVELPLLSKLLDENQGLRDDDGFVLCIWLGEHWTARYGFKVPDPTISRMIRGLGRLFDRDTGDVRFVCLEHAVDNSSVNQDDIRGSPDESGLSLSGSVAKPRPAILSRKRILYAHSEFLEENSEYFKDLLTSGFSESKRYTTIVVDNASFDTLFWVLRYLYTNELYFNDREEDIRLLIERQRLDEYEISKLLAHGSAHYLGSSEWEYHKLPSEGEMESESINDPDYDARTVKSVSSVGTSVSRRGTQGPVKIEERLDDDRSTSSCAPAKSNPSSSTSKTASTVSRTSSTNARPPSSAVSSQAGSKISASSSGTTLEHSSSTPTRPVPSSKSVNAASKITSPAAKAGSGAHSNAKSPLPRNHQHYPLPRLQGEPDPHPHPTPQPQAASALEVYMLADRYRLDALKGLAKEHIVEKMTEENCMPMAFASYRYDDLHSEVLDYVTYNWTSVKASPNFLKCIQEVREDVWGECGPLVLHNIYMRL
ncbi:hypothetical protein IAR55_002993 [Kwoniella newhampshirensis]|uniref:BTB domain-containing protein n=1 Tax=Kwoniella newhampshirensis TaxID=1651941 RepID=A0AAW0YZM0_9TREE